ncbi:MAG: DUF2752 domain-containing protein [Chloroflexota bacterium]
MSAYSSSTSQSFSRVAATVTGQAMRPALFGPLGLAAGAVIPTAWVENGPPLCLFRLSTGMPCPGCGLTRSVVSLMHGDLSASAYYHPLGMVFVLLVLVLVVLDIWLLIATRRRGEDNRPPSWVMDRLAQTPAPWLAVAALMLTWLVRLPFYVVGAWVY